MYALAADANSRRRLRDDGATFIGREMNFVADEEVESVPSHR
jgi:hypothetical protein